MFTDKTIFITGGTGTFGKAFVENVLSKKISFKKIVIFSRDEHKQYMMKNQCTDNRIQFVLGDIRDEKSLLRTTKGVDLLIHAAALKQVSIAEENTLEFVKTNILGTQNVIDAAIENRIPKVIAISTDKACAPIGLYGATKLCAEKLLISQSTPETEICAIRAGNVMGSRGSILELLKEAKHKSSFTITSAEMTRFAMWPDQAFKCITDTYQHLKGGEIYIPQLASFKLIDLVTAVIPHCKIIESHPRNGEKIHEELISQDETRNTRVCQDFYVLGPISNNPKIEAAYTSNTNSAWLSKKELSLKSTDSINQL